jgi:hypothetical protein
MGIPPDDWLGQLVWWEDQLDSPVGRALHLFDNSSEQPWRTQIGPVVPGTVCQAPKLSSIDDGGLPNHATNALEIRDCNALLMVVLERHILQQVRRWLLRHELLQCSQQLHEVEQQSGTPACHALRRSSSGQVLTGPATNHQPLLLWILQDQLPELRCADSRDVHGQRAECRSQCRLWQLPRVQRLQLSDPVPSHPLRNWVYVTVDIPPDGEAVAQDHLQSRTDASEGLP